MLTNPKLFSFWKHNWKWDWAFLMACATIQMKTVSSEKKPARRTWSRFKQTYNLCGWGVEVGAGRGVTARNMNSLHEGSGNDVLLSLELDFWMPPAKLVIFAAWKKKNEANVNASLFKKKIGNHFLWFMSSCNLAVRKFLCKSTGMPIFQWYLC